MSVPFHGNVSVLTIPGSLPFPDSTPTNQIDSIESFPCPLPAAATTLTKAKTPTASDSRISSDARRKLKLRSEKWKAAQTDPATRVKLKNRSEKWRARKPEAKT